MKRNEKTKKKTQNNAEVPERVVISIAFFPLFFRRFLFFYFHDRQRGTRNVCCTAHACVMRKPSRVGRVNNIRSYGRESRLHDAAAATATD